MRPGFGAVKQRAGQAQTRAVSAFRPFGFAGTIGAKREAVSTERGANHRQRVTRCISRLITSAALLFCLTSTAASQTHAVIEKNATVLGFKIHYLEAGKGTPVVLLHGLGGDGSRWAPNIGPLAASFRIIAPDQIGFGQSDKPLANYHTGMLSEFLIEFLKVIGIPKASLVGNSMGASVRPIPPSIIRTRLIVSYFPICPPIDFQPGLRRRRRVTRIGGKSKTA